MENNMDATNNETMESFVREIISTVPLAERTEKVDDLIFFLQNYRKELRDSFSAADEREYSRLCEETQKEISKREQKEFEKEFDAIEFDEECKEEFALFLKPVKVLKRVKP